MERPYIVCHMVTSIDGKVTGDFLFSPECATATEIYYRLNREMRADGFICGRATMEESFTGGFYPNLSKYPPVCDKKDFLPESLCGFYAVSFDTHGSLGWKSNKITDPDGDPGYDGAMIIEVLSKAVDARYLSYLQELNIPYIFAGEDSIDVEFALFKLKTIIGCNTLLLEGGSILNGSFIRADAVDEISLVISPIVADKESKPLFSDSNIACFELVRSKNENGNLVLNYKRKRG